MGGGEDTSGSVSSIVRVLSTLDYCVKKYLVQKENIVYRFFCTLTPYSIRYYQLGWMLEKKNAICSESPMRTLKVPHSILHWRKQLHTLFWLYIFFFLLEITTLSGSCHTYRGHHICYMEHVAGIVFAYVAVATTAEFFFAHLTESFFKEGFSSFPNFFPFTSSSSFSSFQCEVGGFWCA